ncbi:hypothetical protein [Streptomyces sp. NBC_01373]|uniref:hypothetical protein n=1 Tax=Streptomyces sp. NBC_01373 TaxID=2903843 RepID=UPI002B1DFBA2|nr:hypothetical protein [Streptomyces sp. NBC_01373]
MSGRATTVAAIRVEALEQGTEADAESSEPVEPEEPLEPEEPFEPDEPDVPLEPAAPPVEPLEVEPVWSVWSVWPAPVDVPPLAFCDDVVEAVGAAVDEDPADAPSSRTPSPPLHAASVSVAAVIAAATSMRERWVRWVR